MDIPMSQICLGVLAVAIAAIGALVPRVARICVVASYAIALAPIIMILAYFKLEGEAGDVSAILDTVDAYIICAVVLGALVVALDAVALVRQGRRG